MSNNYTQSTVTPNLPKKLFIDIELLVLHALGIEYEYTNGSEDTLYFFSENAGSQELILNEVVLSDKDNFVTQQFLDYIEANKLSPDSNGNYMTISLYDDINEDADSATAIDEMTILQSILKKPECEAKEIIIEGAYTCDKLRQGEFGGFITRITKDDIQHSSTSEILHAMCDRVAWQALEQAMSTKN